VVNILDLFSAQPKEQTPQQAQNEFYSLYSNFLKGQQVSSEKLGKVATDYAKSVGSGDFARKGLQEMVQNPQQTAMNFFPLGMVKNVFGSLKSGPALTLTPNTIGGEGAFRITHWLDGQPVRHIPFKSEAEARQAFNQMVEGEKKTAELLR
jgi:hypothetical protein